MRIKEQGNESEATLCCWMQLLISFHFSESSFDSKTHKHSQTATECATATRETFQCNWKIVFPLLHSVFLHQNGVNYIILQMSLWIRRCYFLSPTPISQSLSPAIDLFAHAKLCTSVSIDSVVRI